MLNKLIFGQNVVQIFCFAGALMSSYRILNVLSLSPFLQLSCERMSFCFWFYFTVFQKQQRWRAIDLCLVVILSRELSSTPLSRLSGAYGSDTKTRYRCNAKVSRRKKKSLNSFCKLMVLNSDRRITPGILSDVERFSCYWALYYGQGKAIPGGQYIYYQL